MSGGLASHLAGLIRGHGPLTVAGYMAEAMGNPRYGYYASRDPFGAAGDFITAPEVSQMFGEMLGAWCATVWQDMGRPDPVHLVEFGPGRGTLMADALRATAHAPGFLDATRIHLIETSALLRGRQRDALRGHDVNWPGRIEDVPEGPVLVLANEFFDALPIRQFERHLDGWHERLIDVTDGSDTLRFVVHAHANDGAVPGAWAGAPIGAVGEISPAGTAVAQAIGARVSRRGGVALVIDYGSADSGPRETLQAVRRHDHHPVLDDPGEADISARVDFSTLARVADEAGAETFGPVNQGDFLVALGIETRAETLSRNATEKQRADITQALERLVGPGEMGCLFKVLAIAPRNAPPPAGFHD